MKAVSKIKKVKKISIYVVSPIISSLVDFIYITFVSLRRVIFVIAVLLPLQLSFADTLDVIIKQQIARQLIPSVSVAIINNDTLIQARSYGLADIEKGIEANDSTIYEIGSITKLFTALCVCKLLELNKINLEGPLSLYLEKWNAVTITNLLNHTSGIPNYIGPKKLC
ncbi:MAG: serine hydrolase domain-containing protein [Bacteroidota bacterium]